MLVYQYGTKWPGNIHIDQEYWIDFRLAPFSVVLCESVGQIERHWFEKKGFDVTFMCHYDRL